MFEQYVVIVDGLVNEVGLVGRGRALELALSAIDTMRGADVAVAEERTLRVCALWRRTGRSCSLVWADAGWLN